MVAVVAISGFDSSGGAGITTDLQTTTALECQSYPIQTAYTVQSKQGVESIQPILTDQLTTELSSLISSNIAAIKIGMLATLEITQTITSFISQQSIPVILDPVLAATSGKRLLEVEALPWFRDNLIPRVNLLTPNIPEVETLLNKTIKTNNDIEQAAIEFIEMGVPAVLIKGGHGVGSECCDYLRTTASDPGQWLCHQRLDVQLRGTGCRLSTAVACYMAKGFSLGEAVKLAKDFVYNLLYAKFNRQYST
jgi:hydroxymethylpyrimidine kinase/phosphomethylpyrimidine kinase